MPHSVPAPAATARPRCTPHRRAACGLLAALFVASPFAAAGDAAVPLSATDAAQIGRLAVVSLLGGSIRGTSSGLSVFQRRYLDLAPDDWHPDPAVAQLAVERVRSSGRLRGATVELLRIERPRDVQGRDRRRPVDDKRLAALAREQGYDAVLAIVPEAHREFAAVPAGVAIVRQQGSGATTQSRACAALAIRVLRSADARPLASVAPAPCMAHARPIPWHPAWDDYTPDEQRTTLDALRRHVLLTVSEGLSALGIRPGVRPGNRAGTP